MRKIDPQLKRERKNQRSREYRKENREMLLLKGKLHRQTNAERLNRENRERYRKDPEKFKAIRKKSFLKHQAARLKYYRDRARDRRLADPEGCREYQRKWRSENKEKARTRERVIYAKNRSKIRAKKRAGYHANLDVARARCRRSAAKQRIDNINYKIASNIRSRLNYALRGKAKADNTISLLGCSIDSFKIYLESKFQEGMSWDNYGFNGWHIDHIMPCAIFDLSNPEHQKRCFHFSNLQPMWAFDNRSKGCRVKDSQYHLI